jgi:hypothetical protein
MRSEELRVSVAYPEGVLAGTVSKHYGLSSEMFSGSLFFNWYEDAGRFFFPSSVKNLKIFLFSYICTYDLYGPVPNAFDAAASITVLGQVGGGWALGMETFLGPVKWHRADRQVPFGAQNGCCHIKSITHRAV